MYLCETFGHFPQQKPTTLIHDWNFRNIMIKKWLNILFEYRSYNNMRTQSLAYAKARTPPLTPSKAAHSLLNSPSHSVRLLEMWTISNKTNKKSKVKTRFNLIYLTYFFTSYFFGFDSFHDTNSFYNQTNTWRRSLHRPHLKYTHI